MGTAATVSCIGSVNLGATKAASPRHQNPFPQIFGAELQGAWNGDDWKLALQEDTRTIWVSEAAVQWETFPICREGGALPLAIVPGLTSEAALIFEGRRQSSP
jgi:hypothetical protein